MIGGYGHSRLEECGWPFFVREWSCSRQLPCFVHGRRKQQRARGRNQREGSTKENETEMRAGEGTGSQRLAVLVSASDGKGGGKDGG